MKERKAPPDLSSDPPDLPIASKEKESVAQVRPDAKEAAEEGAWRRAFESGRHSFSHNLIGWCLFLLVAVMCADHWDHPAESTPSLDPLIETLKLVLTTALGFAFARNGKD